MAGTEKTKANNRDSFLTARIPVELKQALEAEAEASGRTITQVAVGWMDRARATTEAGEALNELTSVGETLRRLDRFAKLVAEHVPDPAHARAATIDGWRTLMHLMPAAGVSAEELALLEKQQTAAAKAGDLIDALREIAQRDREAPVLLAYATPPEASALDQLVNDGVTRLSRLSPIERLMEFKEEPSSLSRFDFAMDAIERVHTDLDYEDEEKARDAAAELFGAASEVKLAQLRFEMAQRQAKEKGQALLAAAFLGVAPGTAGLPQV